MSEHPNCASFRKFINETLPAKIGQAIPLVGYQVDPTGVTECSVKMTISGSDGEIALTYQHVLIPGQDGSFAIDGQEYAVVMCADRSDLETALIACAGEQAMAEVGPRIVAPPEGLEITAELLRSWLPLDRWIREFILHSPTSSKLTPNNWLDRQAALRRMALPDDDRAVSPTHIGRVCPFETPEGPNCGRILHLAAGAQVVDGRIVIHDDSPAGALGLTAAMAPLLEHNDQTRQLMGCNMMRQWLPLGDEEPALVQTGNEPDAPGFWAGRNLLTAFIHWKGLTYEDGIVVSETCATRLTSPEPLEVGDKLSNRHGTKGVISAILPDSEMPHLPDGRPVDIIFDPSGLHTRLNFGQIREALLGSIGHARGKPVVCPPFESPSDDELREMLRETSLPEDGQVTLTDGSQGGELMQPSTVGYVYWGKLCHRVADKMQYRVPALDGSKTSSSRGQRFGEMEVNVASTGGAFENILERLNTCSQDNPLIDDLGKLLTSGPVQQAAPPTPGFLRLRDMLRAAGVGMGFDGTQVQFGIGEFTDDDIELAAPVPHPWDPERELTHVGRLANCDHSDLLRANQRAAQTLAANGAAGDESTVREELARRVREHLDELPIREALRPGSRTTFSGRSVIVPGPALQLGQVGLPEEVCKSLFAPLVARKVGLEAALEWRPAAEKALAEVLEENVVLLNRAPSFEPTNITAFRPVMAPGRAIQLHPLCCRMFNADFDGDQMAFYLPVTELAQQEAKDKLTIEGHLRRDPGTLVAHLAPTQSVLLGLACAARSASIRAELLADWPKTLPQPPEALTRHWLINALAGALSEHGESSLVEALQQLMVLGFRFATRTGASLHPFVGAKLRLPAQPNHRHVGSWLTYAGAVESAIISQGDLDSPDLGPQLLAVQSGARGSVEQLRQLIGPRGSFGGHYFSGVLVSGGLRNGIDPGEHLASALPGRRALQALSQAIEDTYCDRRDASTLQAVGVLSRAAQSEHPGEVFAAAARNNESDPLTDPQVRLFAGLKPQ